MQAQATRPDQQQDVMTAAQSLQSIQTLLRAGLGCITYLRNLLPTDNFSESYLTSAGADPQPSGHSYSGSFASDGSRRNVSGFKIMTVKRGYTEEADKLMDYLENGIFDALQKQYLRSFIFAIYLDNEDPNNIVEAYTFNFHYHLVPGSNKAIPVMTLGDELTKLSLSGKRREMDPVAEATRKGQVPTLGEVKRSLKTLIKNLIQATTQMDALPRRRYATFKLFYHDNTPDDYEPPHFRSGDAKEDKWFFSTHGRNEVPEKCSVGQVQTGWHGVDLRVASVSGYLPSAEDNDAPFMGTTAGDAGGAAPVLTPVEEAALRKQQVQAQRQDAEERRVVWDAEEGLADADAEGEEDDGDDSQLMGVWRSSAGGVEYISPLGIRDDDGNIVPISDEAEERSKDLEPTQLATEPTVFKGVQEKVPRHIGQLVLPPSNSGELSQTQKIDSTQPVEDVDQQRSDDNSPPSSPAPPTPLARRVTRVQAQAFDSESLPPSDPFPMSIPSVSSVPFDGTIDTQELKQLLADRQDVIEDAEMLDANTQLQQYLVDDDPIESFSASQTRNEDVAMGEVDGIDAVLDCECGVNEEDCDFLLCEGGCNKWFHAWCMGYHSGTSDTVPDKFICFDCRVHADQNWDLIMVHNLHPRMMAKFRDLALFRRAIKVCEIKNPESLSTFTKGIGCEAIVAGQVFKRLENEGFITLQDVEEPDAVATRGKGRNRGNRGGGKKTTGRRKAVIKQRYAFVTDIVNEKLYKDYFNPDPEVEKRLLGLDELRPKRRGRRNVVHDEDDDMYDAVSTISSLLNALPLFHRDTTETVVKTAANKAATAQLQEALLPAEPQGVSQTQPETQLEDVQVDLLDLKRHASDSSDSSETGRKTKRVKISIGPAVDLGD